MNDIVKVGTLEELLKPFNNTQRMYISLVIMGYSPQQACIELDRKPATIDRYLTDVNFRELVEFASDNREKFKGEARGVWLESIDVRAMILKDRIIDKALDVLNNKELQNTDLSLLRIAKDITLGIGKIVGDKGESYDELILKKHRAVHE